LTKHRWQLDHDPGLAQAVRRLNIAEWIVRCLGGEEASDASLPQRNQTLAHENKRLRAENTELRDELAALLGERRAAGPATRGRQHTA